MKSLTVRLPDVLAQRIEQAALARGVSKSDIVREGLNQPQPPLLKEGALRNILEEGWAAQVPAKPPHFRSPKKVKLAEIIRAKKLHR
jgi:predicted transcriptional regulator